MIKFIAIDEKTQTTQLEIIKHKKTFNKKIKITIDSLSADEIKNFIQQHKQDLNKYQGKRIYLNRSNGHYDVYRNSYAQNIAILQQSIVKGKNCQQQQFGHNIIDDLHVIVVNHD